MGPVTTSTLDAAAEQLAALLRGGASGLRDPSGAELDFEARVEPRPLSRTEVPPETWAVDGGQALVADARCLQLVVTRAARVCVTGGGTVFEDDGELRAALLGGLEQRIVALSGLDLAGLRGDTAVDIGLLRDRWEWDAVSRSIEQARPGAFVLVDGDLEPDWRLPSSLLVDVLARAAERGVTVAGITKHTSLARGGAPLLGSLELDAEVLLGPRATWWAPIARTRSSEAAVQVVAARLDPDARFAFRVDLPASANPEIALGALSALSDDAAFPGYPYPLSVADRLAACPPWLRAEVRMQLDDLFDRAGLPLDVRERALADRHALMERA